MGEGEQPLGHDLVQGTRRKKDELKMQRGAPGMCCFEGGCWASQPLSFLFLVGSSAGMCSWLVGPWWLNSCPGSPVYAASPFLVAFDRAPGALLWPFIDRFSSYLLSSFVGSRHHPKCWGYVSKADRDPCPPGADVPAEAGWQRHNKQKR